MMSRMSYWMRVSLGTMPSSSAASNSGSRGARRSMSTFFTVLKFDTMRRAIASAWPSSIA